LFEAGAGEAVVLGLASAFRELPFGTDPAGLFDAVEGGIEGAFFDAEELVADTLDAGGDAVAVHGFVLEDFEDEEIEGALEDVVGFGHDDLDS
jgi:hypothetical protein